MYLLLLFKREHSGFPTTHSYSVQLISFPTQMQDHFIASGKRSERNTLLNSFFFFALSEFPSPTGEGTRPKHSGSWRKSALFFTGELTPRVIIVITVVVFDCVGMSVSYPIPYLRLLEWGRWQACRILCACGWTEKLPDFDGRHGPEN